MKPTPERIINRLFGNRSPAAIDAIMESTPVRSLLDEVDGAEVARRAALLKQMQELPSKHEKGCIAANKEVERAKQALDTAHEAVKAMGVAHCEAYGRAIALSCRHELERSALERDIERSADARIWRFIGKTLDLYGQARHFPAAMVLKSDGTRISHFDGSLGTAACEALNAARDAANALMWQALTTEQVTKSLERIRADLVRPLEAVNLVPPRIDEEPGFPNLH